MSEPKLKPCPFCGNDKPRLINEPGFHYPARVYYAWCHKCGVQAMQFTSKDEAITA
ncbi:MAG: Lar family restriction alleviation protein [Dehalococcoidia bacterium]|nr:Lar family restriction alleviation protein [Dehalococcoidia bacterium]